jgi:hypothetical protein
LQGLGRGGAEERELIIAGLVALEGVAVVAGEAARPVGVVGRPGGRLESQTLLHGLKTKLVYVGNTAVTYSADPAGQSQHQQDASHLICINYNIRKNYCGLKFTPSFAIIAHRLKIEPPISHPFLKPRLERGSFNGIEILPAAMN